MNAADPPQRLPRFLCGVVLLVILLATLYSLWIWIVNFTRIHV